MIWFCRECGRKYPNDLGHCPHCNNRYVKDFINKSRDTRKRNE